MYLLDGVCLVCLEEVHELREAWAASQARGVDDVRDSRRVVVILDMNEDDAVLETRGVG